MCSTPILRSNTHHGTPNPKKDKEALCGVHTVRGDEVPELLRDVAAAQSALLDTPVHPLEHRPPHRVGGQAAQALLKHVLLKGKRGKGYEMDEQEVGARPQDA